LFSQISALTEFASVDQARAKASHWLEITAAAAARQMSGRTG
jgi:hypothetical protein